VNPSFASKEQFHTKLDLPGWCARAGDPAIRRIDLAGFRPPLPLSSATIDVLQLFIMNADGSNQPQITFAPTTNFFPTWGYGVVR